MTPRSLVGMTMGARKRAAAYEARHTWDRIDWDAIGNKNNWQREWRTITRKRLNFYIGQRLRPCPGCRKCGYEPTVKMWKLSRDALWMSGRLGVRDIRNICDGSGVLPAKGKVRR